MRTGYAIIREETSRRMLNLDLPICSSPHFFFVLLSDVLSPPSFFFFLCLDHVIFVDTHVNP